MTGRRQIVRRRARQAVYVFVVLAAVGLAKRATAARSDIVFSPPTDSVNVAGVIPLGNLNPKDGHVLAVDHNYLVYPVPFSGGAYAYPVRAMATGSIVMLFRQPLDTGAGSVPDYGIYIRHTRSVTSYVIHVHELSTVLGAHVAGASWTTIRPGFEILLLGQGSAPPLLGVAAGDDLGVTRSYTGAWDVGVIDTGVRNDLLGRGPRRYPTLQDYADSLGLTFDPPYRGHQTRNAACFIDYLEGKDQTDWFFKLTSDPISCGRAGWDVAGTMRGAWFSQSIDDAATPDLFELQTGVLSVIPDNLRPDTGVQIGIGAGTYSPIDHGDTMAQLDNPFKIAIDVTPGGSINPDPASVGVRSGTVCYDLAYNSGGALNYDRLLLRLIDRDHLRVRYDATAAAAPSCAAPLPDPDATWATYVR